MNTPSLQTENRCREKDRLFIQHWLPVFHWKQFLIYIHAKQLPDSPQMTPPRISVNTDNCHLILPFPAEDMQQGFLFMGKLKGLSDFHEEEFPMPAQVIVPGAADIHPWTVHLSKEQRRNENWPVLTVGSLVLLLFGYKAGVLWGLLLRLSLWFS